MPKSKSPSTVKMTKRSPVKKASDVAKDRSVKSGKKEQLAVPVPTAEVVKPLITFNTSKLFKVYFDTPHTKESTLIVEAKTVQEAVAVLSKVLLQNTYIKVNLNDTDKNEAIFLSSTCKITKAVLFRG